MNDGSNLKPARYSIPFSINGFESGIDFCWSIVYSFFVVMGGAAINTIDIFLLNFVVPFNLLLNSVSFNSM